jgi:hypothetical protein
MGFISSRTFYKGDDVKKLTFLEALKVNESKEIKRLIITEKMQMVGQVLIKDWVDHTYYTYKIGELKNSDEKLCDLMETDFYTEPDKFEFECEWRKNDQTKLISPMGTGSGFFNEHLQKFVGKKTKVTVEVIDEQSSQLCFTMRNSLE